MSLNLQLQPDKPSEYEEAFDKLASKGNIRIINGFVFKSSRPYD